MTEYEGLSNMRITKRIENRLSERFLSVSYAVYALRTLTYNFIRKLSGANRSIERGNLRRPVGLCSLPLAMPIGDESRQSCVCGLILFERALNREEARMRLPRKGKTNKQLGAETTHSKQEPWDNLKNLAETISQRLPFLPLRSRLDPHPTR